MHGGVRGRWSMARFFALVAIACALAMAVPAIASARTVTGSISDELGLPLGDAEVAVLTVDAFNDYATAVVATTTSDPDGTFSVDVPGGTYLVAGRDAPDYPDYQYFTPRRGGTALNPITAVANTGLIPVPETGVVENIDLRMLAPVFIEGRVVRASDSEPLGGIIVTSVVHEATEGWHPIEEAVTLPDGTYRLQTLSSPDLDTPGALGKIQFRDPDGVYATSVYDSQVFLAAGTDFDFVARSVTQGIDATLTVGGGISGRVTDAVTGAQLAGVSVEVFRFIPLAGVYEPVDLHLLPIFTAADGGYRWGGLPPGTYKVKFAGEPIQYGAEFYGGLHISDPNIVPHAAAEVVVEEGVDTTGIDGELDLFDGASPVTYSNIDAQWHLPGFEVSLTATDPATPGAGEPSGVATTTYQVGAGPILTGTRFTVSVTGVTPVRFRSSDRYGNVETTKTAQIKIDGTPPVTTHDAVSDYIDRAVVSLTPTDTQSGVATTRYRVDNGPVRTGRTVTVFGQGGHTVRFWSVDKAGNTEAASQVSFDIVRSNVEWDVIAGADRVATSIAVSQKAFPPSSDPGAVVLATSRHWADATGGAALAGAVDAPVLLLDPARPGSTLAEVERLRGLGASRVFILGGTASIPSQIEWALIDSFGGDSVVRLGGRDRFATSRAIAARTVAELGATDSFDGTVFLTGGDSPFDALAASPIAVANGWPVLLAEQGPTGGLTPRLRSHLVDLGVDRVVIVGGTRSVPSAVTSDARTLGASVSRLSGPDRYATAARVATWGVTSAGMSWDGLAVANGSAFADSLSGSVLLGRMGSVLLLTPATGLSPATASTIDANKDRIFSVTFLGGSVSMPPAVRAAVIALLS